MKASWKYQIYKVDANEVAKEILPLTGDGNTAEKMVEKARSEDSVMHSLFEWDDAVAGQKYRISQAHQILRSLKIVREEPTEKPLPTVRFFVNTGENTGTYEPTIKLVQHPDEYEKLLQRAKGELATFRTKYKSLNEFRELIAEIDLVLA